MTRYETACQQAMALRALVEELTATVPAHPELPAIVSAIDRLVEELVGLGPASAEGRDAHHVTWLELARQLNKQVRLLDEALANVFSFRTRALLEAHDAAMETAEAALVEEAIADQAQTGVSGLDGAGQVPGRAEREAAALRECWPEDGFAIFALRDRVRRARLGRYPAGFAELEMLLVEMDRRVPHVLDVSGLLADLHRRRTWEEGFYPVLDTQGALLEAIDVAFAQGVTALAATAPKKVSFTFASGLEALLDFRARAEALTDLALRDATEKPQA
jgi:hypothetical protein